MPDVRSNFRSILEEEQDNGIWEYVGNLDYFSCFSIAKISRKPTQKDNSNKERRKGKEDG